MANPDAVVLDMSKMKNITLDGNDLTIQGGVVFEELVEFVRDHRGALPVGTGPTVGVLGYVLNGGLSGYFSRRLGLLGQRVTKFSIVLADGSLLRDVTRESDPMLFGSVLGAGSALGVVTEITVTMASESILQSASQFVAVFDSKEKSLSYTRSVLQFFKTHVLNDDSLSLELVYTANNAVVLTFVFYDSFAGNSTEYVGSLKDAALDMDLVIEQESEWTSWYEAASALWPVIAATSGTPRSMLQHSIGTRTNSPSAATLDFITEAWVGEAPLVDDSIVEIRSLGGAIAELPAIPSGNVFHPFFSDTVIMFDGANKTASEVPKIQTNFGTVIKKATEISDLSVDVSGTHSQPDDVDPQNVVTPSVIFGTPKLAQMVMETKQLVDPNNRFRFHPFYRILETSMTTSPAMAKCKSQTALQ